MTRQKEDARDFVLEPVCDAAGKNATRAQNAAVWKNLLSTEDYVLREHVIGLSRATASPPNQLHVFVLKAKDKPDAVLCSCEILVREAWRFSRDASGTVTHTPILCGCIGGVFTPAANRGRGLASIMIDKLMETARREPYVGPDGFTFLYSEVGEYYTRNGFKSYPVDLVNTPLAPSGRSYEPPRGVELVRLGEFDALVAKYSDQLKRQLSAKVARDGLDRISIQPSAGILEWFNLRAKFFGAKLFGEPVDLGFHDTLQTVTEKFAATHPQPFGLKLVCPETGEAKGFVAWQYEYNADDAGGFKNYLSIIKIAVFEGFDADSTALELVSRVKEFCEADHGVPQLSNLQKFVLWESDISAKCLQSMVKRYGSVAGKENGSRSAIMFNNAADDESLKSGRIVWEENTKLPWF